MQTLWHLFEQPAPGFTHILYRMQVSTETEIIIMKPVIISA